MAVVAAVLAGVVAFGVAFLFDWVAMKRISYVKPLLAFLVVGLHGYGLYVACWGVERFGLPTAVSILGWVVLAIFVFSLFYSLAVELPPARTYGQTGAPEELVTTGTYALTRHPGVLWYILSLVALTLATRSEVLLIAAPVWSLLNVLYTTTQDRFFFVKMFPGYREYQRQTPMFVPTLQSVAACWRTFGRRSGHAVAREA